MPDYLSEVDLDPFKFFGDVAKEVVHQVTGYDFEDKKKRRPSALEESNKANAEAVKSAIEQQKKIDKELGKNEDDSDENSSSSSSWF